MRPRLSRFLAYVLTLGLVVTPAMPAYAGMVGTQTLVNKATAQWDRARLSNAVEREEVRILLADHGISLKAAKERIDALTDREVRQLAAADFDKLPAGSGVIEVLVIAGLVVVILELVGITDIFTQF
ncbi:MAG: PA2779 family protein [Gammaproteobacteria bacterium]|nr:PA2779 family protein [Gammaproteobacteria bacterium]